MKKTWDLTLYALFFTPTTSYFHLRAGKDSRFTLPRHYGRKKQRTENLTGDKTDHDSPPPVMMITITMMIESLTRQ